MVHHPDTPKMDSSEIKIYNGNLGSCVGKIAPGMEPTFRGRVRVYYTEQEMEDDLHNIQKGDAIVEVGAKLMTSQTTSLLM